MIIKALKTFSDEAISMYEGQIANVPDVIATVIISWGYAREYSEPISEADLSDYTKKSDLQAFQNDFKLVITFETMPSDEVLLSMSNNTEFRTLGYYDKFDRCGGRYRVTINWNDAGIVIGTKNGSTVFLVALDDNGNERRGVIELVKYGIRGSKYSVVGATLENTYAEQNVVIFNKLKSGNLKIGATFELPEGYFYFASPISNGDKQLKLKGASMPLVNKAEASIDTATATRTLGTTLLFPFLTDGQTAITWGGGVIENINVVGNRNTYNITFDRTQMGENPDGIVTEQIAEVDNTQVKCTGIKSSANVVKNVNVSFFYTGLYDSGSNSYYTNVHAYRCHSACKTRTDTKFKGIYGWNVHTLFDIRGSLVSGVQLRADNCVNAVSLYGGGNITVLDVDADICIDALLNINANDLNPQKNVINGLVFQGHGRCNVAKCYNSANSSGVDVSTLADSNGYGVIRVNGNAVLKNSKITLNQIGKSNPYDNDTSTWRTPNVLLSLDTNADAIDNIFEIVNSTDIESTSDLSKVVQMKATSKNRIDTAKDTYFINGLDVDKYLTQSEVLALIQNNATS